MDQNPPVLAEKVWSLVRVVSLMLRKGISKRKLLLDLNMMVKRGKLAGKTLQNLMFNHNNRRSHNSDHLYFPSPPPSECEFSCTTSPVTSNNSISLFSKKHHFNNKSVEDHDKMAVNATMMKAVEMIHNETASPELLGFERSPVVRQLRVTDSPFTLNGVEEDNHVDEEAEQFISWFYNDLQRQNTKGAFGS